MTQVLTRERKKKETAYILKKDTDCEINFASNELRELNKAIFYSDPKTK